MDVYLLDICKIHMWYLTGILDSVEPNVSNVSDHDPNLKWNSESVSANEDENNGINPSGEFSIYVQTIIG